METGREGQTTTVRVSRQLREALEPYCPGGTAGVLGPVLEVWVAAEFAKVPDRLARLLAEGERPAVPEPRRRNREGGTLRLPWWQVRRLGIVAEVSGLWVGKMVEDRLWAWLAAQPAGPARPARRAGKGRGGRRKKVEAVAAAGRR